MYCTSPTKRVEARPEPGWPAIFSRTVLRKVVPLLCSESGLILRKAVPLLCTVSLAVSGLILRWEGRGPAHGWTSVVRYYSGCSR